MNFFPVNHFSRTRKKIWVCRITFLQPEKRWTYSINPPFFWSITFLEPEKKSEFAELLLSNQISKNCKKCSRRNTLGWSFARVLKCLPKSFREIFLCPTTFQHHWSLCLIQSHWSDTLFYLTASNPSSKSADSGKCICNISSCLKSHP